MVNQPLFKVLGLTFLILSGVLFLFKGISQVNNYFSLSQETMPKSIDWSIEQVKSNRYILKAYYQYSVNGADYEGMTRFLSKRYPNVWAAEMGAEELSQSSISVWYSGKQPKKSSLYKFIPIKSFLSSATLFVLIGYFLLLNRKLRRQL